MRRDQRQPAHAMILIAAGIDRRDRGAVGMAEQDAAAEADRVEQLRQHIERLDMHVVERARQLAPASTRHSPRANRRTRRRRSRPAAFRESRPTAPTEPRPSCSMTMVGAASGCGTDHAVFEIGGADAEEAGGGERSCRCIVTPSCPGMIPSDPVSKRSSKMPDARVVRPRMTTVLSISRNLKRWILPVAVFGRLSTTSIQRGYFQAPIFCLTCSFSASCRPSVLARRAARRTPSASAALPDRLPARRRLPAPRDG